MDAYVHRATSPLPGAIQVRHSHAVAVRTIQTCGPCCTCEGMRRLIIVWMHMYIGQLPLCLVPSRFDIVGVRARPSEQNAMLDLPPCVVHLHIRLTTLLVCDGVLAQRNELVLLNVVLTRLTEVDRHVCVTRDLHMFAVFPVLRPPRHILTVDEDLSRVDSVRRGVFIQERLRGGTGDHD